MSIEFGKHLRELRNKSGYTQQQMADFLNISRSTYTYYETGKSEPGLDKIKIMCEIFNIDYNTILKFE
jgi:transcriptional regulator with XRE-family HTH domain